MILDLTQPEVLIKLDLRQYVPMTLSEQQELEQAIANAEAADKAAWIATWIAQTAAEESRYMQPTQQAANEANAAELMADAAWNAAELMADAAKAEVRRMLQELLKKYS